MRVSRITAAVALVAITLYGSTAPVWGLAPPHTQTVKTTVPVLCTASIVPNPPLPEPPPFPPLPPPSTALTVTLTVPLRVHSGAAFDTFLAVDSPVSEPFASRALLAGAPGITPTVGILFVLGSVNGSLRFTATGRAGTLANWRLNEFDVAFFIFSNSNSYLVEELCVPTTSSVLASTRIIGH